MTNNMDDLFANVKKMVDSGNIPDDIKQMMNNMSKSNSSTTEPNSNNILDQISPEMINNLSNMLNSSNQTSKSENFSPLISPFLRPKNRANRYSRYHSVSFATASNCRISFLSSMFNGLFSLGHLFNLGNVCILFSS